MKTRIALLVLSLLFFGLSIGIHSGPSASATVPGVNQLVNADALGNPGNDKYNQLGTHTISGDGRYVAFASFASNLVPSDANAGASDVFVKDMQTGNVTLINISDVGVQSASADNPAISYDGRYVVFESQGNLVTGVTGANLYIRDLVANTIKVVSINNSGVAGTGNRGVVSADGRYVAFSSNSVPLTGDTINSTKWPQLVLKDMQTGELQTLSKAPGATQVSWPGSNNPGNGNVSISCDGHIVSFISSANLTYNTTHTYQSNPATADLYYVEVGWGGTNGSSNKLTNVTRLGGPGIQGYTSFQRPQVSCDGNYIAYARNDGMVYRYNRLTDTSELVSKNTAGTSANQITSYISTSISGDGRYVAFSNISTNLDPTRPQTYRGTYNDVFVRDTRANTTQVVSFTALGNHSGLAIGGHVPGAVAISADGSTVAYPYYTPTSSNPNGALISGTLTGRMDVYTSKTGF